MDEKTLTLLRRNHSPLIMAGKSFLERQTMQTDNRFFDDMAKMAGGALNALTGLKTEMEAVFRQQIEQFMGNLNLVSREEFEAVQALAAKARDEQEALAARLAAVEAELAAAKAKPAAKAKAKSEPVTE